MSLETLPRQHTLHLGGEHDPLTFPVLDAEPGPAGRRLSTLVGRGHPLWTFIVGVALSFAAIAGLSIVLGLLLTDVILKSGGIASGDGSFVRFLSHHRSTGLTDASLVGSIIAGGVVLPIVVAAWGLIAAAFKHWRVAAFPIFALGLESGSYRVTTLLVHRHRPDVPRLEKLPVNASYPSGHTAAAIAVYCGLALLLASRIESRAARVWIWLVAGAIPVFVALARMYRGMHHPLDVLGGVAIGIAALAAMVTIARATRAAER